MKNSLGIPTADFVEDVEAFMQKPENNSANDVIKRLDELLMKYKFMEQSLLVKKSKLNTQVPDIQNNLEMLRFLNEQNEKKADFETSYQLDFHLYSRATVKPTKTVGLWLGANVMLEYPIEEAEDLLKRNLENAKKSLKQTEEDLDFLKDQLTTTEVNIARVYNWNVLKRRPNELSTGGDNVNEKGSVVAEA